MNEDRLEGKARAFGGKVEQAAGRVTGDAKTQVEGILGSSTSSVTLDKDEVVTWGTGDPSITVTFKDGKADTIVQTGLK